MARHVTHTQPTWTSVKSIIENIGIVIVTINIIIIIIIIITIIMVIPSANIVTKVNSDVQLLNGRSLGHRAVK